MNNYINELLIKNSISIFGFEIKFYGIIIASAMLIGLFVARYLAKKRGIDPDEISLCALFIIPLSILGARIYYCIFSDTAYTFSSFWKIREGGLAIYGGVIGGIIGIILYCLIRKKFNVIVILFDCLAPVLILGQALGRWGNFFNQEAYGNLITNKHFQWFPFGVYIDEVAEWHLATFFYESILNLIGFVILLIVFNKSKIKGTTTATYLVYYGSVRFLVEGLRTDSLYFFNTNIRVSQILSLILVVIGISILVHNYFVKKKGAYVKKD